MWRIQRSTQVHYFGTRKRIASRPACPPLPLRRGLSVHLHGLTPSEDYDELLYKVFEHPTPAKILRHCLTTADGEKPPLRLMPDAIRHLYL